MWGSGVGVVVLKRLDGRARRRRRHPRRHPRHGDQQRRIGEGRLHGAERRGAGGGHRAGAGRRRRRSGAGDATSKRTARARRSAIRSRWRRSRQAFGPVAQGSCAIGSLKSNIGHLDAAAGVAGLIKTTLALDTPAAAAEPALRDAESEDRLRASPFFVNTALASWTPASGTRVAGVSSFGIGGTNAHVVVEEAPATAPGGPSREWQVLVLSARTAHRARSRPPPRLADHLERHDEAVLADVAFTLQIGRQEFAHRRVVVCRDVASAVTALRGGSPNASWSGRRRRGRPRSRSCSRARARSTWTWRASCTGESRPSARVVDECAERLRRHLGVDLRELLYDEARRRGGRRTEADADCAAGAVRDRVRAGEPLAVVGVRAEGADRAQLGEYVRACLAGVFTLDDALALVAARGRADAGAAGRRDAGGRAPRGGAARRLEDPAVSLAAVNGHALCVVSGPIDRIAALEDASGGARRNGAAAADIARVPLRDDGADRRAVHAIGPRRPAPAPQVPFISNVTGTWITDAEALDPAYWGRHLRAGRAVRRRRRRTAAGRGARAPRGGAGPDAGTFARQHPACGPDRAVLTSLRHPQQTTSDAANVMAAAGRAVDGRRPRGLDEAA